MDSWLDEWMTLTIILVPICNYCLKWTKFGQLILTKIIKIVATRSQILRLKWTKFWLGLCPTPRRGSFWRSPRRLVAFYGFACKERRKGSGVRECEGNYGAKLSIPGTSHGPVSVCLSVRSRCSTKTDERIELVFGMWASFRPSYAVLKGNLVISKIRALPSGTLS